MAHIRRATVDDARTVAPRLREADRRECRAMLGLDPEIVLPLNVSTSPDVWAMVSDQDEPIGLFGVSPVDQHPDFGIVWMTSTPELFSYSRKLLRDSPTWLDRMHDIYPLLGNHVDCRNTAHIRWLRWLGFSLLREIPEFGVERRPFIEFAKLRS